MSEGSPLTTPLYDLDEETVMARLPSFPLTSRNAIMAYYGALELAAEGLDPASDEAFLTPNRLAALDRDDWVVLSLDLDLRDPTAPTYLGVSTHSLTDALQQRLGLSRYPNGKRDHSITNIGRKSSPSDIEHAAGYLVERLTRWPDDEAIQQLAADHDDGFAIKALLTLAENVSDEQIKTDLDEVYDGNANVVATVRVRADSDDWSVPPTTDTDDEFYFPGEVPVYVSAAAARNRLKLASKNVSGISRGQATCSVETLNDEVIGAIEDPLGLYALQHTDEMLGFDDRTSWRQNSVSPRMGPLLARADSLLDACYWSAGGMRVYALPYFAGEQTYRSAVMLHDLLCRLRDANWDVSDDAENQIVRVQQTVNKRFDDLADRLRFYCITLRTDSSGVRVFYEEPAVSALPVWDIAETYATVRDGVLGTGSGFTYRDGWSLLAPATKQTGIADQILSRGYVFETMLEPYPQASDYKDATSDPREEVTYATLTGSTVDPEWLLEQYLRRLDYDRRENDASIDTRQSKLKQQFVQYQSLAAVGSLSRAGPDTTLSTPPQSVTRDEPARAAAVPDGGTNRGYVQILNDQLDEFIDTHPVLADHAERRAAFLAGMYVSIVSKHQREQRQLSRTFMDRYDMSEVTPSQLMQFLPDVLSKDQIYAREASSGSSTVAPGIRQRLPEHLAGAEPRDWDITPVQFRYFYSLGTAYGSDASYAASAEMNGTEADVTTDKQ